MPVAPSSHKPTTHQAKENTSINERWGKGRGGHKWRVRRERIFKRDKYLCQICLTAGRLTPVQLHGPEHGVCDHIKPLGKGGSDDDSNLQTICQACDKAKTSLESRS